MTGDLNRRVERLERDTGEKNVRVVWLNPGDKPKAAAPGISEKVLNVSWHWSGGDAA
jgi:hypothetical protein